MKKIKPRVGDTIKSLANALEAISELMTFGYDHHGGTWEGGRLSSDTCTDDCNNSMLRHLLDDMRGDITDEDDIRHDVAFVTNALIRLERRIRDDIKQQKQP